MTDIESVTKGTVLDKQLERGLQKALEYSRYKERGIASNPFNIDYTGNIWKIKVGRDDELILGVESLREMADKNTKLLNITGTHGIGKTLFSLLLYDLAKKYNSELGFEKIILIKNDVDFKQNFVESSFVEGADGEIFKVPPPMFAELRRANKPILIFIDDADIIFQYYAKIFMDLTNLQNIYVVSTWNRSAWDRAKHRPDIKLPSAEILILKKMTDKECDEILRKRIQEFKISKRADELFSKEIIETLSSLANGSPHRIVRLAKRLLIYMMEKNLINIKSGTQFDEFLAGIEDINYESLMKKLIGLSETQKKIVSEMKNIVEADATKIGLIIGMTRVGAFKQLRELEKLGILTSHEKNRKRIYQLREEIEYGTEE
ncbi:MAG: hypothetical protein AABY07_08805 [Nanoarchaeota archaeon]